ncbi:unnamed protein product [Rhizophagus irregularis]|nr:unnamed protein product [Rhizophagus irregularis]
MTKCTLAIKIAIFSDHRELGRKTCNEDVSNAKVNDRIMNQIPVQDKLTETNLRKRKERDDVDFLIARLNE